MFVLIIEHDHAEWDVTLHASRAEAEQAIRDFAREEFTLVYGDEVMLPSEVADCVEFLATGHEYVKVFEVVLGGGPGEEVAFNEGEAIKSAA